MSFAVWDFIFQPFLFQIRSSGGFYLCRTNLHRSLTPLQQALFCAPLVSFPTLSPKPHTGPHRGEFVFSPQNGLTPPPKGGGSGYHLSWVVGFALLVHNWPTRLQQGGFAASLVSFSQPRPLTGHISPHRGEFGFGLLAGASKEDHPPFRQSRVRNRAEEKTPLPCFSKIEPVKFVIPCKRFSKPPGENPFSLFMRRRFCAATGGPPGRMLHGIFAHKQRTRPFHGRVLVYHLILWRDGSPSPARSNLYATASWMGRIVYRSTPFCTLPSLPWTVVFSVSMSLFSSNR